MSSLNEKNTARQSFSTVRERQQISCIAANSSSGVRTLLLMYTSPLIAQQAPGEDALELPRRLFLERHLIRGIQLRWSAALKPCCASLRQSWTSVAWQQ